MTVGFNPTVTVATPTVTVNLQDPTITIATPTVTVNWQDPSITIATPSVTVNFGGHNAAAGVSVQKVSLALVAAAAVGLMLYTGSPRVDSCACLFPLSRRVQVKQYPNN